VREVLIGILCVIVFSCLNSCGTTPYQNHTTEYREIAADIGKGQAELAIIGERIEARSGELERSIGAGTGTESERLNWQSQAREIKSEAQALNDLLQKERVQYWNLEKSFNSLESENSNRIAVLVAQQEKDKRKLQTRLVAVIALVGAWVLFIGFKVYRCFHPISKIL